MNQSLSRSPLSATSGTSVSSKTLARNAAGLEVLSCTRVRVPVTVSGRFVPASHFQVTDSCPACAKEGGGKSPTTLHPAPGRCSECQPGIQAASGLGAETSDIVERHLRRRAPVVPGRGLRVTGTGLGDVGSGGLAEAPSEEGQQGDRGGRLRPELRGHVRLRERGVPALHGAAAGGEPSSSLPRESRLPCFASGAPPGLKPRPWLDVRLWDCARRRRLGLLRGNIVYRPMIHSTRYLCCVREGFVEGEVSSLPGRRLRVPARVGGGYARRGPGFLIGSRSEARCCSSVLPLRAPLVWEHLVCSQGMQLGYQPLKRAGGRLGSGACSSGACRVAAFAGLMMVLALRGWA